ncbi:MAG: membrane protease YdiL (CAAX protease family) [Vicingaceae bacterium]
MSTIDSRFSRILTYTALTLASGFLFSLFSFFVINFISEIPFNQISSELNNLNSEYNVNLVKVLLFMNSFGLFVLPPLVFCYLFRLSIPEFFKLNEFRTIQLLPVLFLLFVLFLPVLNFTVELNKLLILPDWLSDVESWMKTAEDSATEKTTALLQMNSYSDLFINLILVGLLPAIGEELAFRGVVQQTLIKHNKNPHWGIWGAAFIFSFIHFQFFGFLPRLLLGAFFGYLFFWSKSLWLPILGHFINNASAVLISFYFKDNGIEEQIEQLGTTDETNYIPLISVTLFGGLLYYFKKQCDRLLT